MNNDKLKRVIKKISSVEELEMLRKQGPDPVKTKADCTRTVIVLGHVDHGKTTLTSAATKVISDVFHKSPAVDYHNIKRTPEERMREVTIVVSYLLTVVYTIIKDEPVEVNLIWADCPGHHDYIGNTSAATGHAQAVIVVVDPTKGMEKQTIQHLALVATSIASADMAAENSRYEEAVAKMGIDNVKREDYKTKPTKRLVIAQTRADQASADDIEICSLVIEEQLQPENSIKVFGRDLNKVFAEWKIVQISAAMITQKPAIPCTPEQVLQQYNTLLDVIHYVASVEIDDYTINQPFRMEVEAAVSVKGRGIVLTGSVKAGSVKAGDELELYHLTKNETKKVTVTSIETFKTPVATAKPGDNIGIICKGDILKEKVNRGDLLAAPGSVKLYNTFAGKMYISSVSGKKGVMESGAELSVVYGSGRHTSAFIFLEGLSPDQREEVAGLVKKGARLNKSDAASQKLKDMIAKAGFKGATARTHHDVLVTLCNETTRLPIACGSTLSGLYQGSKANDSDIEQAAGLTVQVVKVY